MADPAAPLPDPAGGAEGALAVELPVDDGSFDADWAVVGSGFGGSVAALRLSERGHRVTVVERGRRFADADFARSTWNLRRYFWAPVLGLRGICRLRLFRDVLVLSGAGVGGGSLGYANTLYVPHSPAFFADPQWSEVADWQRELAPHYAEAERMLGVTQYGPEGSADRLVRQLGEELGVGDTYQLTRVGVFLGGAHDAPGVEVDDPFFDGAGPRRTPCTRCGACMVGCPVGAKNTLVKNYLWFAERAGATITPDTQVRDVRPLPGPGAGAGEHGDGSAGYELVLGRPGALLRRRTRTMRVRGVVIAAGALGTNELLQSCRRRGSLGRLSARLGSLVRTNSEAIVGLTGPPGTDFTQSVAISSSIYPDEHTHIEPVTYGPGGGAMKALVGPLVGSGTRVTRPLKFLAQVVRHPVRLGRIVFVRGWARRTVIMLVMQSSDNSMRLRPRRWQLPWGVTRLTTVQDPDNPNPTFIPVANWAAERGAAIIGGLPQSSIFECLFNIPTTAHILGGAPIGASPETGVVDGLGRAFGYRNLLVCDGSTIPANVGVNPSLTITALAERAMAAVPPGGNSVHVAATEVRAPATTG